MSDEIGRRNEAWRDLKDAVGFSLLEAQKLAEEHGFDSCSMTMLNKAGAIIKAKWLDAYFGMFQVEGDKHFISVDQVRKVGIELWVLNMVDKDGNSVKPKSEETPG